MLAIGLVARAKAPREEGHIDAMNGVESRIASELERISRTRGFNDTIIRNADKVERELRVAGRKLEILLDQARSTLRALGVDMLAHELAAEEPVAFRGDGADPRATGPVGTPDVAPPGDVPDADVHEGADFVVAADGGCRGTRSPEGAPPLAAAANEGSSEADLEAFLAALAACVDGRSGNISLCADMGWERRRYDAARDLAVDRGLVGIGRGRGGTVQLLRGNVA